MLSSQSPRIPDVNAFLNKKRKKRIDRTQGITIGHPLPRPINGHARLGEHEFLTGIRKCESNDYLGKLEKIRVPGVSGRHEANFSG
jgi:hypothetical protein